MARAAPSSSDPFSGKPHDVFISFRGEDTRRRFTSHLHAALSQKQIQTWKDNLDLEKGAEVWPALVDAINNSYLCIVVFSKNYASSTWCLRELTHIVETKEEKQVIPVFYEINPSYVRKQTGSYKKAFQEHKKDRRLDEEAGRWRDSLRKASDYAGFDSESKDYRDENHLIENIVKVICQKLDHIYPRSDSQDIVGINEDCTCIESLLEDFRVIGLWGMGGIGKTTIADVLFRKFSSQYEGHCFLDNVSENSGELGRGLPSLRQKLFSKLLKEPIESVDPRSEFVNQRIRSMKVFIVLDDVNSSQQVAHLVGDVSWKSDSKIIITTRDKEVLGGRVDAIHEVMVLDDKESLQLFCLNAFRKDHPEEGFVELSKRAVSYAKNLPLALKLLGSPLRFKSEEIWKRELEDLKRSPNKEIDKVLRLSFNGLEDEEKEKFLDIAFFFKGEKKKDVENFLKACKFYTSSRLDVLHNKALITISELEEVKMHDLIQEMGWKVVREQCIKDPKGRNRLKDSKDICDVLKNNKENHVIEGMIVDLNEIEDRLCHFNGDIFEKMTRLRFLKFYFHGGEQYDFKVVVDIFDGRRFCQIQCQCRYDETPLPLLFKALNHELTDSSNSQCLHHVPATFCVKNVVHFIICQSPDRILWDGKKDLMSLNGINIYDCENLDLMSLNGINIYDCENLTEVSDLSKALKLESITLSHCSIIKKLWDGTLHLMSLNEINVYDREILIEVLNLSKALKLESRTLSDCPRIKKLWDGTSDLVNLKEIDLSWCINLIEVPDLSKALKLESINLSYCESIKKLWDAPPDLVSLKKINLSWCVNLTEVPDLSKVLKLESINLSHCLSIKKLWDGMPDLVSLKEIDLSYCVNLIEVPDLFKALKLESINLSHSQSIKKLWDGPRDLVNLKEIDLSWCADLIEVPDLSKALKLESINLSYCESIKKLWDGPPDLVSLKKIDLSWCVNLTEVPALSKALKLELINLSHCLNIKKLWDGMLDLVSLKEIDLSSCVKLTEVPDLSKALKLKSINLSNCRSIKKLWDGPPDLVSLKKIDLSWCANLIEVPDFSKALKLESINLSNCPSIKKNWDGMPVMKKRRFIMEYYIYPICKVTTEAQNKKRKVDKP